MKFAWNIYWNVCHSWRQFDGLASQTLLNRLHKAQNRSATTQTNINVHTTTQTPSLAPPVDVSTLLHGIMPLMLDEQHYSHSPAISSLHFQPQHPPSAASPPISGYDLWTQLLLPFWNVHDFFFSSFILSMTSSVSGMASWTTGSRHQRILQGHLLPDKAQESPGLFHPLNHKLNVVFLLLLSDIFDCIIWRVYRTRHIFKSLVVRAADTNVRVSMTSMCPRTQSESASCFYTVKIS